MAPVYCDNEKTSRLVEWVKCYGWWAFVIQTAVLACVILRFIDFSDRNWSIYVNVWWVLAWTRLTTMLAVIFFVDLISPGHTIRTILDIEKESSFEDKRTAMWFLVILAALSVWAISGGLGALGGGNG